LAETSRPHRLVADIDAALEQQILDVAQRQRVAATAAR
jgi:hypothetical protein